MTMQPAMPPPSWGYFLGQVPAGRREHVYDEIADGTVQQLQSKLEAAWDTMALVHLAPRERLASYRMKPAAVWDEQWAKYPLDADEDWKDYQALIAREQNGDFL